MLEVWCDLKVKDVGHKENHPNPALTRNREDISHRWSCCLYAPLIRNEIGYLSIFLLKRGIMLRYKQQSGAMRAFA
jgi:hypothetical protein